MPQEPSGDAADRRPDDRAAEDAAWRAIIDNYGERPLLEDESAPDEPSPDEPAYDDQRDDVPRSDTAPLIARGEPAEEHYVPPPPPPVPVAEPARLLAWIGLFGVPTGVLVALVARLEIPEWLGLLLMVWFVGGFVYLVASMRPGPRDDDDDGAVV